MTSTTQRSARTRLPWPWLSRRGIVVLATGYAGLVAVAGAIAVVHHALFPDWQTTGADARVIDALASARDPLLLQVLQGVSLLGKIWVVAPLVVVVAVLWWRRTGSWDAFWLPGAAGAGGLAISVAVKYLTARPRPPAEVAAVEAFGPAFPSGHVIRVTAVYAALTWLVGTATERRLTRAAAWGALVTVVVAVAFARLYEAAHWPVDVVVSFGVGAGWLTVLLVAGGLVGRAPPAPGRWPPPGRSRTPGPRASGRSSTLGEAFAAVTRDDDGGGGGDLGSSPAGEAGSPASAATARAMVASGLLPILLVALVVLSAAASGLTWLATTLIPGWALTALDHEVAREVLVGRSDLGMAAMRAVTTLGDLWFVAALVIALGTVAALRTSRLRPLWFPAAAGAGAFVISVSVKYATGRARPPAPFATVEALGPAFPSGHALRAMAVYASVAWLAATVLRRWHTKVAVWAAAATLILGVGFSRVYLGAHWVTDVVAGYVLGAVWLTVLARATLVAHRRARATLAARRTAQGDTGVTALD